MILVLATIKLLAADASQAPSLRVTFASDAFAEPRVSLVADSVDYGAPIQIDRHGEVWQARFETDLRPGPHEVRLIAHETQDESSSSLQISMSAWPPGCPAPPTRWQRIVHFWHRLFP